MRLEAVFVDIIVLVGKRGVEVLSWLLCLLRKSLDIPPGYWNCCSKIRSVNLHKTIALSVDYADIFQRYLDSLSLKIQRASWCHQLLLYGYVGCHPVRMTFWFVCSFILRIYHLIRNKIIFGGIRSASDPISTFCQIHLPLTHDQQATRSSSVGWIYSQPALYTLGPAEDGF